jgi:hypothetical protein
MIDFAMAAEYQNEGRAEFWPVIESCVAEHPDWALALFNLFGAAAPREIAGWFMLSQSQLVPTRDHVDGLSRGLPLSGQLAVQWWAHGRHGVDTDILPQSALATAWAARVDPFPAFDVFLAELPRVAARMHIPVPQRLHRRACRDSHPLV